MVDKYKYEVEHTLFFFFLRLPLEVGGEMGKFLIKLFIAICLSKNTLKMKK